ncbi:Lipase (class 3) [Mycolicibacterium chubuense NBB4]|uniref:Lipase (Class 3) n=1 Tax=Mycolicibacterium chubuense (strain NBB4) TaxID=710421 RepID=I4BD21_MYCCN|nr:lipase family protein [Mycolicibacterium chubuense]AFM15178.1 Lipase (class 3) [Mycolicibacterium chubuense NBB4]
MSFDPQFARDTVLPLVEAAYQVFDHPDADPTLPAGYQKTALLKANPTLLDVVPGLSERARSYVRTVAGEPTVFGLVGKNAAAKTAFVAIRGTRTETEWLDNLDFDTTAYRPVPNFGDVHMGWMGLYESMRANLAANLPAACAGCQKLIVTGHSLGAALAVLAAPDIAKNLSVPEPELTTFGGPRPGLYDFVVPFNLLIDTCFRVVNLFDIVPHLPLALPELPYTHVGVQIAVNSGGSIDQTYRHSVDAYRAGLTGLMSTEPAWAA